MKVLYLDCFSGISGDMLLGALFDLGATPRRAAAGLARLGLPRWSWRIARVKRGAFAATRVDVRTPAPRAVHGHGHAHGAGHRGLVARVMRRAARAGLPPGVATRGNAVLAALLRAEGKVHGVTVKHVHLHEVEDVDTVVDVFGAILALHELGVDRVWVSPVVPGTGHVHAAHGELPVPAPGTAELLRGRTVRFGEGRGELVTPTGAALLAGLAEEGPPPPFTVSAVGYGAGARETAPRPNLLRAILGTAGGAPGGVAAAPSSGAGGPGAQDLRQMEALVDDASPQLAEQFLDRARADGALEAWAVAVQAKRSRPAVMLCALAPPDRVDALLRAYFEETGSLGVRVIPVARHGLARRMVRVATRWGPLTFKVAGDGATLHAVPEWREVKALAARHRLPARFILDEAKGAWRRFSHPPKPPRKH